MNDYTRPAIAATVYRDADGEPIAYGTRWGRDSPPDESYSRTSNLERFAPLHTIAEALIEWLDAEFAVTLDRNPAVAGDVLHAPVGAVSAVRVTPADAGCAPLTFVLTSFPGVILHAGALHDFPLPVCGCDACDDDVFSLADELEWTVRTVVGGGYSERFEPWPSHWIDYRLDEPDVAMRSGRSRVEDFPDDRVTLARGFLPRSGAWAPWPRRA